MEEFTKFISEHIPDIVAYTATIIIYILHFVIKKKMTKNSINIKTFVKEQIENMGKETDSANEKLAQALATVNFYEARIAKLERQIKRQNKAILSVVKEVKVNELPTDDEDTRISSKD